MNGGDERMTTLTLTHHPAHHLSLDNWSHIFSFLPFESSMETFYALVGCGVIQTGEGERGVVDAFWEVMNGMKGRKGREVELSEPDATPILRVRDILLEMGVQKDVAEKTAIDAYGSLDYALWLLGW